MKARLLVDIKEFIEAGNEIDYIFICGDIAYKGIKEEYENALAYIDEICGIIGRTREDVFVVPGNHDLNRNAPGHQTREMIDAALAFEPNNEAVFDNVLLKDGVLRKDLFAAFTDYNAFADNFFCKEAVMDKCIAGKESDTIDDSDELYYEAKLLKKVGDIDVTIRGVNTALNCDSWDWNDGYTAGHKQMLPHRAYVMEKEEKQVLRIIMGHHPIPFLTSGEDVKDYLDNHYHIQLFGHVHMQSIGDGNCVMVQSGALDPPKEGKNNKYLPVYNIIEISQTDETHVFVKGVSQIWDKNKFVNNDAGSFEKVITVERNINKWGIPKMEAPEIDKRAVKFMFMKQEDRSSYFNRIAGVDFEPACDNEYDNCLKFLSVLEKMGKLAELNELMK